MNFAKILHNRSFDRPILGRALLLAGVILSCALPQHASAQTTDQYRLGPEDSITITVIRHPEFSGEYFIPADGHIDIPAAGQTVVTGRTLNELSNIVSAKLKDRLLDPEVIVALKTPRMQRVYILGAAGKPGLYDMKPGWRITEALSASGGLSAGIESTDCKAIVLRAGNGVREVVSLSEALRGISGSNLLLNAGDVLTIEAVETIPVYVMGQVKSPGLYRVRLDSAGVMEAITMAGGTMDAANLTNVSITHLSGKTAAVNLVPTMLEGKTASSARLQSGDLVVVPESTSRIAVLGFVKEPGYYTLKDGQTITLSDAIGLAKGTDNKRAGINAVAIVRTENGKQQHLVFDMHKFLKTGDITQNPVVRPGDVVFVPETNKFDWEMIFRGLSTASVLANPFVKN